LEIPKEKLAQASGLFNTIRQIGGSFGVALLGTFLTERIIYHSTRFSEAVNKYSPQFKHVSYAAKNFVMHNLGNTSGYMFMRVKGLIIHNLMSQAFIEGINDDFLFGAIITAIVIIPVFFISARKKKNNNKIIDDRKEKIK